MSERGFAGSPFAGGPAVRRAGGHHFRMDDMGDLGRPLRRRWRRPGPPGRRRDGRAAGPDMEAELHLSFQDAVHGVTTTVNVPRRSRCSTCGGPGAAPGTPPHICHALRWAGASQRQPGPVLAQHRLPGLRRAGTLFDTPCPSCARHGTEQRAASVKVRIPPGVEDGQRIRVKGRGAPGQGMAPPGDLYVVVHVAPPPRLRPAGAT